MANTYYDSNLTGEQIEQALKAIDGVIVPANNGKVLAINNGKIEARSVQWGGGEAVIQPLSVTQNGTYNPPSGVDGYSPVTVNVSGGSGGSGVLVSPAYQGVSYGYVIRSGQEFWSYPNQAWYLSAFEVQANHKYAIYIGETVGNRRRASFFAGKTIADFMPYITQGSTETSIYSGGIWLAPFTQGPDDTGNALTGRIIYAPQSNGIILYVSDYNSGGSPATTPAYCVDMDASGILPSATGEDF